MPRKRNKTPPPSDDEPWFFTVVFPYPLNANMELDSDRRNMTLWLACCTGKDSLAALYHKPRSRNMVIIEVNRSFQQLDRLLGQHKWEEFLQNPTEEEKERYSSIFFCTKNTVREVSKAGWKRVAVEEFWFSRWTPENKIVVSPYPQPHHCAPPVEDHTGAPLCRPLPVKLFPRPPSPDRPPPVGSPEWLALKDKGINPEPPKSAWGKGSSTITKVLSSSSTASNASKKGSPLVPSGSVAPRNIQLSNVSAIPSNLQYASPASSSSAFGTSEWFGAPQLNASSSLNAKTPTTDSLSSSDSQSVGTPVENGGTVHIEGYDFEQAMSSLHLDEEDDEYGEDDYGFSPSLGVVSEVPVEEDSAVDYWADYGKAVEELIDEDLCPSHGKLCRKGICQDYAAKKRQEKFEKRRKEIEDEKKRKKKGKDDPKKFNYSKARPDHLTSPQHWGQGKGDSRGAKTTTDQSSSGPGGKEKDTPPHTPVTPAPQAPTNITSPPALAAARPARGRRMNSANVKTAQTGSPAHPAPSPAQKDQKPRSGGPVGGGGPAAPSSNGGWGHIPKAPWDASTQAPSVAGGNRGLASPAAVSSTGGWGHIPKAPWDASTQAATAIGVETGRAPSAVASSTGGWGRIPKAPWDAQSSAASGIGERAPSVAASSTGGWGHISKAPWDAESSAASSVGVGGGDGKGRGKGKGKGKKGPSKAPSEAASSTGGWGHIPKAPWDDPSVRAPSVAGGDDDDTKTINGDEPREKKGGRNNSNKPHMKSWADQVEDEGVW